MPDMGFSGWIAWLVAVGVMVAIPALAIAIGIRIARIGRDDPRRVLRHRLAQGEITPAEYEEANRALGA